MIVNGGKAMFNKIIKTFFTKTEKVKCITVIKNREISNEFATPICKKIYENKKTCLSEYFVERKGLNTKERLSESAVSLGSLQ